MTDILNENGLQTSTAPELLQELQTEFKAIYGEDVLLDSSTPDGQWLNILVQKGVDVRGLLSQLYNSFNPNNTQGTLLDQRCAINNVFRKAGTFTTVTINVVTDRALTLQGLDDNYNNPEATGFTVQDNEGNRFILANTTSLSEGSNSLLFRAENLGKVIVLPNTITTPVTIVLGVVSVNNPTTANAIGSEEESDEELKLRRRQSVAISSFGYLNGLQAALLQLDGVTDAKVYENYTSSTDANGTPAHCIWVVMDGGAVSDIAETIYSKKSVGANMRGNITYTIVTPAQTQFVAKWDNATVSPLYIKFNIKPSISGVTFNQSAIKEYIEENLLFKIGDYAETASITEIAQDAIDSVGGQGYALNVLISSGGSSSVTVTGIDSATVDDVKFQQAISDTAGTYVFTYHSNSWQINSNDVDLADYGIVATGVPSNNDTIQVVWTASSWVEYLNPIVATRYSVAGISITEI